MLKFLTGGDEHMIGLILQATNVAHLREKPLDNAISINGTELGRPDVRILISYARSGTQARKSAKQKISRNAPAGCLTFAAQSSQQKLIGIILTEPILVRFEADPLGHHEIFDGLHYNLPGLKVFLSYSDSGRAIVRFMREMGVSVNQFATDPNLRLLWNQFEEETVSYSLRMARFAGHEIPTDEVTKLTMHKPEDSGMSETAILDARGRDIAYFQAHPRETEYLRRAVKGELPPEANAEWVKVINVPESERPRGETVRIKIPMNRVGGEFVEAHPPKVTNE